MQFRYYRNFAISPFHNVRNFRNFLNNTISFQADFKKNCQNCAKDLFSKKSKVVKIAFHNFRKKHNRFLSSFFKNCENAKVDFRNFTISLCSQFSQFPQITQSVFQRILPEVHKVAAYMNWSIALALISVSVKVAVELVH